MDGVIDPSATLPLFDRFPLLRNRVAWTPIGEWPTPILHADAFARESGLSAFYIKREDLSHPQCGGNKTRGLEFLIARARELRADCLVTFSSAGSHHIAKTAWHARRFGIDCVGVFVDQPASAYVRNNIAAALSSGATYLHANRLTVVPKTAMAYWRERRRRIAGGWRGGDAGSGRPVYFIAPGGTNRRSMLGHVNAALELKAQIDAGVIPTPDFIFVVLGSLGTAAGLALGLKLAGLTSRVVGVTVSYPWYATRGRLARFARRVHRWMRQMDSSLPHVDVRASDFDVLNDALGDGYAQFTRVGRALAERMRRTQGLQLDGTYTAKALDGAMRFIERHQLHESTHLFWHTFFDFPPSALRADEVPAVVRSYWESPGQAWL